MTLRDYFAAMEQLTEWDDSDDGQMPEPMAVALGGPKPSHGWNCKTSEECIAMLEWDARVRSRLKYIRADAMIAERSKKS